MNKITITYNPDNELTLSTATPMPLHMMTQLLLTSLLEAMNAALAITPQEQKQEVKEYIFNQVNMGMTEVLNRFAPDIPLRPDITEEAIMDLEYKLAFEKINQKKNKKKQ